MLKTCIKCHRELPTEEFYLRNKQSKTPTHQCKECQTAFMKAYRAKERLQVLQAYSGENPKCACPGCSESRIQFLTLDHINGNGRKHREELRTAQKGDNKSEKYYQNPGGSVVFRSLRHLGYPPGYRVLCYNCNMARGKGPCPIHETLGIPDKTPADIKKEILTTLKRLGKLKE